MHQKLPDRILKWRETGSFTSLEGKRKEEICDLGRSLTITVSTEGN